MKFFAIYNQKQIFKNLTAVQLMPYRDAAYFFEKKVLKIDHGNIYNGVSKKHESYEYLPTDYLGNFQPLPLGKFNLLKLTDEVNYKVFKQRTLELYDTQFNCVRIIISTNEDVPVIELFFENLQIIKDCGSWDIYEKMELLKKLRLENTDLKKQIEFFRNTTNN